MKKNSITVKCSYCTKEFVTWPSRIKINWGKFCSRKCSNLYKVGKPSGQKGNTKPSLIGNNWNIGRSPWNKGLHPKYVQRNSHPMWKGGRTMNTQGYVLIYSPDHPYCSQSKYVREHRLVVESQIGRYLKPEEKVHHIGDKVDNRAKMLIAFENHGFHMVFEKSGQTSSEGIIFDGRLLT